MQKKAIDHKWMEDTIMYDLKVPYYKGGVS